MKKFFEESEYHKYFFDRSLDALIMIDRQSGKILDLNEIAKKIYGFTAGDYIDHSSQIYQLINNSKEDSRRVLKGIHKKKDGTDYPVDIRITNYNDNDKNICFLAIRDFSEQMELEEEIKSNEAHFRELFDSNPTAMILYELDTLKFIEVNDAAVKQYGYSKEEFSKMTVADIRPKEEVPKFLDHIIENKDFDLRSSVWKHKRKDGSVFYVEITSHSIIYKGKKARFVQANDITERKNTYKRVNQLSQAVEQSPVTIVITDTEGNIEYVNQKGAEITGYDKDELIGKNPRIFGSGKKSKEEYKFLWDTIKSGGEWRGEFHNKKKSGELYWEFATISPIKNDEGEITHFLAIKEDITERKQHQKELIIAKEKAEEINRIKSIFFSNMSHELRTPLSGILGFSELLIDEIRDPEQKKMIEAISMNGQRLLNTLNEILHISKLEAENPEMKLEEISLIEFLNELVKEFETNLYSKGLYVKLDHQDKRLFVHSDKEALKIIITNLLTNAIKFTSQGGITISCDNFIKNSKKMVKIEIIDTGIGISYENQKLIFDEFRQVSEGFNRYYEGAGLGLTIAKKYTEILGGNIRLESELGKGSKFTLEFPVLGSKSKTTSSSISDEELVRYESEKPLVLLVEDDYMNSDLIKKSLENLCDLHVVESGEEALKFVNEYKYDTILMDIGLGMGMNGLETTKQIRLMPDYKEVPIIAVTAYAMNGDKEKFLSSGLSGYISKPFKMRELVDVLGKALKLI